MTRDSSRADLGALKPLWRAAVTAYESRLKMANDKLTITLTDRSPVTIVKDEWPVIASAKDWDNQHESQANRTWRLTVRQHKDGRAIVYGVYDTAYQNERDLRAGKLLTPDPERVAALKPGEDLLPDAEIVAAIREVASNCGCEEIAQRCIADLPSEEI